MFSKIPKHLILGLLSIGLVWPIGIFANEVKISNSIWIPYWKKNTALSEVTSHLNQFNFLSPFSYEVRVDGTLIDRLKISQAPWPELLNQARVKKIKIVPTILWTDSQAMQQIFFNYKKRRAHIAEIVKVVTENNFEGIDIDYENKFAYTKPYFSKFLRELSSALHLKKKILICTIEPRTPSTSRFNLIPLDLAYVNDYAVINSVCDQVRLMAYDQLNVDIRLNQQKGQSTYYVPIADRDWVLKVINLAKQSIDPKKLVLGLANYAYEFEVSGSSGHYTYKKIRALTYKAFMTLAKEQGASPIRNLAGELSFVYTTSSGKTRVLSLSDSVAIAEQIKLAQETGLAGVVLFRADSEADPMIWSLWP